MTTHRQDRAIRPASQGRDASRQSGEDSVIRGAIQRWSCSAIACCEDDPGPAIHRRKRKRMEMNREEPVRPEYYAATRFVLAASHAIRSTRSPSCQAVAWHPPPASSTRNPDS